MSVAGVKSYATTAYESKAASAASSTQSAADNVEKSANQDTPEEAAVYEKSSKESEKSKTYKADVNLINRLKADLDQRRSQLVSMVEKMLTKQGLTFQDILNGASFKVDEATRLKAQEDISENGYWGVEQTSDRLVEFAKGLTGGDPSQVKAMRDAIEKGFKQAEERWGGKLPDICQKTYEATMKKLDAWENDQG